MSVTRTLAIRAPFYSMNRRFLMLLYLGYGAFLVLESAVRPCFQVYYLYIIDIAYCVKGSKNPAWSLFSNIFNIINMGIPSLVILVSFVLTGQGLAKKRISRKSTHMAHKAQVTIAIFTGIFLICNIPFVGNAVMFIIARYIISNFPGPLFSSRFMLCYSWVLSKVVAVVINAALNPLVYFARMQELTLIKQKPVIDSFSCVASKERYRLETIEKSTPQRKTTLALVPITVYSRRSLSV